MKKSKQSKDSPLTVKFTLAMRLTAIVVLTMCLQLYTRVACAQHSLISLSLKDAPLDMVLVEIRNLTGTNFMYDIEWLKKAKPVTINMRQAPLLSVLDSCFANQPFTYAVTGSMITIIPKDHFQKLIGPDLIEVAGTVINTDEIPLEGATVRVKGTTKGISTDADGNFILKDIDKSAVLEVSYIGYSSQVIRVKSKVYIQLEMNPMSLDAAETKGYSSVIRRYNLASTKKITAGEISIQPINNILAALQGRVTGVVAVQQSGLPGSGFDILIRGRKSIGAGPRSLTNSPLFLIDGVPFLTTAESLIQTSLIMANTPFSTINPNDVESIEILKDANATSIYGSLGANGVILITTRKPKAGKTSVDVKMSMGWARVARTLDYMNTQQYLEMRKEALANDGAPPTSNNAKDLLLWDTTRYTDWKKELIGGTARYSTAHIRISGGSENTQFMGSVGYNKETTVFPGDFNKSLVSLNLQVAHNSENKKLELLLATSLGYDKSYLSIQDITTKIADAAPSSPPSLDSMGNLIFRYKGERFANPYVILFQPYKVSMTRQTSSIKLNYKIFPSLQLKTNIGYNVVTADEYAAFPISSKDPVLNPTGTASFGKSKSRNWLIEPQLEVIKNIREKSRLKALAGISFREQATEKRLDRASGYTSDAFIGSVHHAPNIITSGESKEHRLQSVYGLVSYTFDLKYLVELTGRIDGSSRFGLDKRFGNFSSVATGWIFSNEKIIKKALPFISYGKLRISHGTTGINPPDDYLYLDAWDSTQYPYTGTGYVPTRTYNNDLRWELNRSTDIGVDLGFLKDRIMLSVTWNKSRTEDQIILYPLPSQTGFASIIKNSSPVVGNKNFELELNTVNARKSNFKWITSLNLTISRNKLLTFPGYSGSTYNAYIIGKPLNLTWGYRTQGIDPVTGIYNLLDKDGNIIPIPNRLPSDSDLVQIGGYDPTYYGGLQNSIHLGNWKLDILFQFVNQKGRNQVNYNSRFAGFLDFNQPLAVLNRWQKPGDNAPFQRYTQDVTSAAYMATVFRSNSSDALITDASYIRLKTLSVSYSLPEKWIQKLKLKNCSFFLQTQNLLTITSYKGNHDPESGTINPTGLPPLKIVTFGIQASL